MVCKIPFQDTCSSQTPTPCRRIDQTPPTRGLAPPKCRNANGALQARRRRQRRRRSVDFKLILRQFFIASTAKSELFLLVWFSISIFLIRNQAGLALSPNFRVFPRKSMRHPEKKFGSPNPRKSRNHGATPSDLSPVTFPAKYYFAYHNSSLLSCSLIFVSFVTLHKNQTDAICNCKYCNIHSSSYVDKKKYRLYEMSLNHFECSFPIAISYIIRSQEFYFQVEQNYRTHSLLYSFSLQLDFEIDSRQIVSTAEL